MGKSYSEKLKSPKWQKARLRVLDRDDFTCQHCGEKESTLHVHHGRYLPGREPWDYPDNLLITVCNRCHEAAHNADQDLARTDFAIRYGVEKLYEFLDDFRPNLPPKVTMQEFAYLINDNIEEIIKRYWMSKEDREKAFWENFEASLEKGSEVQTTAFEDEDDG